MPNDDDADIRTSEQKMRSMGEEEQFYRRAARSPTTRFVLGRGAQKGYAEDADISHGQMQEYAVEGMQKRRERARRRAGKNR